MTFLLVSIFSNCDCSGTEWRHSQFQEYNTTSLNRNGYTGRGWKKRHPGSFGQLMLFGDLVWFEILGIPPKVNKPYALSNQGIPGPNHQGYLAIQSGPERFSASFVLCRAVCSHWRPGGTSVGGFLSLGPWKLMVEMERMRRIGFLWCFLLLFLSSFRFQLFSRRRQRLELQTSVFFGPMNFRGWPREP